MDFISIHYTRQSQSAAQPAPLQPLQGRAGKHFLHSTIIQKLNNLISHPNFWFFLLIPSSLAKAFHGECCPVLVHSCKGSEGQPKEGTHHQFPSLMLLKGGWSGRKIRKIIKYHSPLKKPRQNNIKLNQNNPKRNETTPNKPKQPPNKPKQPQKPKTPNKAKTLNKPKHPQTNQNNPKQTKTTPNKPKQNPSKKPPTENPKNPMEMLLLKFSARWSCSSCSANPSLNQKSLI